MTPKDGSQRRDEQPPPKKRRSFVPSYARLQLIYVAAELGIADLLQDEPKRSEEVARSVGADARALHRVMRGLVGVGVLAEGDDGRFELTPLGQRLQKGAPDSARDKALEIGEIWYPTWGGLLETVRSGRTAFDRLFGVSLFEYLAQRPALADSFHHVFSPPEIAAAVLATYDFSSIGSLVDVGGGHGGLIAPILEAHPHLRGILFDTAPVIESARQRLEKAGLSDRCDIVAGDFFAAVPDGGDAYILKEIMHDWDDERAIRILQNCRRGMERKAKLLLVETLMPARVEQSLDAIWKDLVMLVCTGGRERTESEYHELLASGGFRLRRVIPTRSPADLSLIEAVPA